MAPPGMLAPWWQGLSAGVRALTWTGVGAALMALCMLLAFHQVVRGAVQQSESRQKDMALQAEASSRCKALRGPRAVVVCLSQLKATVFDPPPMQAEYIATGAPL